MRRLVILGGGTAGTMIANKLVRVLDMTQWLITVIDTDPVHYYQPGFLFVPFGVYTAGDVTKPRRDFLPQSVELMLAEVDRVDAARKVLLAKDGSSPYDYLIIATGARIRPDQTEGLLDDGWLRTKFDFYTLEGAVALRKALQGFEGGRLVVNVVEMPIKCPVASLEFLFLADSYFRETGMRDKVDLQLVTSLPGAFTKPSVRKCLAGCLPRRGLASLRNSAWPELTTRIRNWLAGMTPKCRTTCWFRFPPTWAMKRLPAAVSATSRISFRRTSQRSSRRLFRTSSCWATRQICRPPRPDRWPTFRPRS
jgi:hypothetical protein